MKIEDFKVGDKVECIDLKGFKADGENYTHKEPLKVGKQYVVSREARPYSIGSKEKGITLVGCIYTFPIENFKKVVKEEEKSNKMNISEIKEGDVVECISMAEAKYETNNYRELAKIKVGDKLVVKNSSGKGDHNWLMFVGKPYSHKVESFKKVENKEETIKTKTMNIKDLKTGDEFTANIEGKQASGKVYIQSNKIFLCQNVKKGSESDDKLGYKYSWVINAGSDGELRFLAGEVKNFIKLEEKKELAVGDKFKFNTPKINCGIVGGGSGYSISVFNTSDTFEVKKINKVSLAFEKPDYKGDKYYTIRKTDFEKFAILEGAVAKTGEKKITGYKLIKDTPDAKAGTLITASGIYTDNLGIPAVYTAKHLQNKEWFEPTYEQQFKEGDAVVYLSESDRYYTKGGVYELGGKHFNKDAPAFYTKKDNLGQPNGSMDSKFRLATEAEVKAWNETRVLVTGIGTKNATLVVGKDYISIKGKSERLVPRVVKEYYDKQMAIRGVSLGGFNATLLPDVRCILIGCEGEDNRVSLNDIKRVIDKHTELYS